MNLPLCCAKTWQLADTFFQGHVSAQQAVGGLKLWVAFNGQKDLPLAQQVEDTIRIFFVGFTDPVAPHQNVVQ